MLLLNVVPVVWKDKSNPAPENIPLVFTHILSKMDGYLNFYWLCLLYLSLMLWTNNRLFLEKEDICSPLQLCPECRLKGFNQRISLGPTPLQCHSKVLLIEFSEFLGLCPGILTLKLLQYLNIVFLLQLCTHPLHSSLTTLSLRLICPVEIHSSCLFTYQSCK